MCNEFNFENSSINGIELIDVNCVVLCPMQVHIILVKHYSYICKLLMYKCTQTSMYSIRTATVCRFYTKVAH
jgi:hypothetical protein